jgi:uncharacterized protein YabE (DUF348 family)
MNSISNSFPNPFQREPNKVQQLLAEQQQVHVKRFKRLHKHPLLVPIATFLVLLAVSALFVAFLSRHDKPVADAFVVIIKHDKATQVVPSREPTVGSLLKKLDITLNEGDVVEPAITAPINQEDFRINVYRAVPVQVVDNGHVTFAFSAATTPRSIAAQIGLTTYAEDKVVTKPIDNFVTQGAIGEQVVIDRATPVNFTLYGANTTARTQATTVAGLIKEKGIKMTKDDQVTPAPATPITPNMAVTIVRNGIITQAVTEPIAPPIQAIQDPNLAMGTSAVRQAGTPGEQITTYEVKTENGQVVSRNPIHTVVTRQPVTQIVVQGTSLSGIKGNMALVGISPSDYMYVDYIISHESGWCPTKAQGQYGACPPYSGSVPTYGGYGLCQSTPPQKMATAGADWATNPVTQLRWCNDYALRRFGSWGAAYNYWLAHHNW